MAIYQFVVEFIPRNWSIKNKIESLYRDGFYNIEEAWSEYKLIYKKDLIPYILPLGSSWSQNILLWGEPNKSDIQVSLENNIIDSIKFRLDLTGNIENLKLKMLELAINLDCYLFCPQVKKIIPPVISELNEAIDNSPMKEFVENPRKFLSEKN